MLKNHIILLKYHLRLCKVLLYFFTIIEMYATQLHIDVVQVAYSMLCLFSIICCAYPMGLKFGSHNFVSLNNFNSL